MIGVIAGTGFAKLFEGTEKIVTTQYGSAIVKTASVGGKEIVFLPRHGAGHSIPPHKINYKANVYALKHIGVKDIIATYACGIIGNYSPGDMIILNDFIALNKQVTFFDDFARGARHTDMTEPYSKHLSDMIEKAAKKIKLKVKKDGIIATTFGPRYETRSEIRALKTMGANLVNMTSAYEVILAREIGINIAGLAVGTNYACGLSNKPLSHEEVESTMKQREKDLRNLLIETMAILGDEHEHG